MRKIQVGIIGLGAVGERLLHQFNNHPETEITAISDSNGTRLQAMKKHLPNAFSTEDYQQLLKIREIDLVYVAVPPKYHHQIVLDVIQAGKHVLCEKPLANSLEEAGEMLERAEAAGVIHAINFPLPYNRPVETLAEKVRDGYLGTLQRIELRIHFPVWPRPWQQNPWIGGREQGGFIREITPHYLQIIQSLFGKVGRVDSFIDYPADEMKCETGIIARMELEDGTPILVDGLSGIKQEEEIVFRMYGDEGVLTLLNWSVLSGKSELESQSVELQRETAGTGLIDELIKAIIGEPAHLITFTEGYAVQEALEKLLGARA